MRIGITGCTGVLGRILRSELTRRGHLPICFEGDLREQSALEQWLRQSRYDAIFSLAAMVAVDSVTRDPFGALTVNVGGQINLLSAIAKLHYKPWLFYASTSHVYKSSPLPIDEYGKLGPQNFYAETKLIGETVFKSYATSCEGRVCIGRIFSFYHSTQKPPFLYPSVRDRLSRHDISRPFHLRGANDVRDIMDAEDVASVLFRLLESNFEGVVNIGSGQGITIKEFVSRKFGIKPELIVTDGAEATKLVADVSLLTRIIGPVYR